MDEFDNIAFADEMETDRGYKDGLAHGSKVGKIEGFSMGMSRGKAVSEEIAFYHGFCHLFKMKVNGNVSMEKMQAKLSKTVDILEKLMVMSVEDEGFSDCIETARKNFKILTSILSINVIYSKKSNQLSY